MTLQFSLLLQVYVRATGGEVGAASSLAPKIGPLGLSPKKVGGRHAGLGRGAGSAEACGRLGRGLYAVDCICGMGVGGWTLGFWTWNPGSVACGKAVLLLSGGILPSCPEGGSPTGEVERGSSDPAPLLTVDS